MNIQSEDWIHFACPTNSGGVLPLDTRGSGLARKASGKNP
jgi:hypothetical protein